MHLLHPAHQIQAHTKADIAEGFGAEAWLEKIHVVLGVIALVENGDIITIDSDTGELSVDLSDDELKLRKQKWKPKVTEYTTGTLWKYSQSVGPAFKGAVPHPGAYKEKKSYADI